MSITDELRKWAEDNTLEDRVLTTCPPQHAVHGVLETLLRIADRIDAEHEETIQQVLMDEGAVPATDENMAEHGWVRLPKDADGEYIHIGDKVTCGASVWEVTGFRLTGGFWGICCTIFNDQGGSGTNVYSPSDLRHYAPTVEDVLLEMLYKAHIYDEREMELLPDLIAEYAAKLRLAKEVDG